MNKDYKHYKDFLKNKKFILWQIMPTDELNEYWDNFSQENPELVETMDQASNYLKTTGLNKSTLSEFEAAELLNRIQNSIGKNKRKTKFLRIVQFTAAACAAIALVVGINLYLFNDKPVAGGEQIIGSLLNSEDIQLITSGKSHTFHNDIEIQLDDQGNAIISQNNVDEKSTLSISNDVLNKLIVPYGKRTQLSLSDGSKVWLNSGSVLEFPAQFKGEKREIFLASGEMFIEVAHDKKKSFHVQTSNFNVKVYGTKFNISIYKDSPQSVILAEGSVSLSSKSTKEMFLKPNHQAVYSESGTFTTQRVNVSQYTSWKDGYLTFEKTSMQEVLKQIGRHYNLSFSYDTGINIQKRTCTGKIYLSDNLDNVLATLGILTSTKHIKQNGQIYITNDPNTN